MKLEEQLVICSAGIGAEISKTPIRLVQVLKMWHPFSVHITKKSQLYHCDCEETPCNSCCCTWSLPRLTALHVMLQLLITCLRNLTPAQHSEQHNHPELSLQRQIWCERGKLWLWMVQQRKNSKARQSFNDSTSKYVKTYSNHCSTWDGVSLSKPHRSIMATVLLLQQLTRVKKQKSSWAFPDYLRFLCLKMLFLWGGFGFYDCKQTDSGKIVKENEKNQSHQLLFGEKPNKKTSLNFLQAAHS